MQTYIDQSINYQLRCSEKVEVTKFEKLKRMMPEPQVMKPNVRSFEEIDILFGECNKQLFPSTTPLTSPR